MESLPKIPLTEDDIKWCKEALAKAEPYADEENPYLILDDRLFCNPIKVDEDRVNATKAKRMLERGWKSCFK